MLVIVKYVDFVENAPQGPAPTRGPTNIVDVGVIDVRCATSLTTLLARTKSLEYGTPMQANLLDGVYDHLVKHQVLIGTNHNSFPRKKGESFVQSYKRFYHRKTKTYHTVTVSVTPLSIPRLDPARSL